MRSVMVSRVPAHLVTESRITSLGQVYGKASPGEDWTCCSLGGTFRSIGIHGSNAIRCTLFAILMSCYLTCAVDSDGSKSTPKRTTGPVFAWRRLPINLTEAGNPRFRDQMCWHSRHHDWSHRPIHLRTPIPLTSDTGSDFVQPSHPPVTWPYRATSTLVNNRISPVHKGHVCTTSFAPSPVTPFFASSTFAPSPVQGFSK
jgi:hypothetical protein